LVQVDNAASENKNRWVFGLLALFVLWGWFDEVQANCLLQGHTHDAQDAVFGVLKSAMAREGACVSCVFAASDERFCSLSDYIFTLGDFAAFLDKAFPTEDTRPSVAVMDNAIDWKAYLDPHLTNISGHTGMEEWRKQVDRPFDFACARMRANARSWECSTRTTSGTLHCNGLESNVVYSTLTLCPSLSPSQMPQFLLHCALQKPSFLQLSFLTLAFFATGSAKANASSHTRRMLGANPPLRGFSLSRTRGLWEFS